MTSLHDRLESWFPNALWHGNTQRREIALTFDDGPVADSTPELLGLLERYQVSATFFHIGQRAANAPHLVQQVAAAGHQIGLHGYAHRSFLLMSSTWLRRELAQVQSVLVDASGRSPENFNAVRPPFGHFTPAILKTIATAGYLPTMWSVVPFHWLQPADASERQVLEGVRNGTILVLHEGLGGPAVTDLAQVILPNLIADGYHFITINEMWANQQQTTQ